MDGFSHSLRNNRLLELFVFLDAGTGLGKDSINIGTLKIQMLRKLLLLAFARNWNTDFLHVRPTGCP